MSALPGRDERVCRGCSAHEVPAPPGLRARSTLAPRPGQGCRRAPAPRLDWIPCPHQFNLCCKYLNYDATVFLLIRCSKP